MDIVLSESTMDEFLEATIIRRAVMNLTGAFKACVLLKPLQVKDYKTGTKHTIHAGSRCAVRRSPTDPGVAVVKVGASRFAALPCLSVPDYLREDAR